ncbi:MAG: ABC transporter permease subunit [Thermoanaerobaculia bacterium]|nr:ABC transporter permease subunit [Thermoanaerobaculia bacterium]
MRVLAANIEEVFREAAARWTLIAYFVLSSLFIMVFAAAVNLDVVDGALAGAKLFGNEIEVDAGVIQMEQIVTGFETAFSGVIYVIGIFLAIFATSHLVPRLQDKGTVDLYLSRPVGRVRMLLSRYVAGLLLSAANVIYLIGAIWLIVIWKTHVVHLRFLLSGAIIMFSIAVLLAFAFVVGVVTSSTAVSIMSAYAVFFLSIVLAAHEQIAAALSTQWKADLINGMYWIFPKLFELQQATIVAVSGGEHVPEQLAEAVSLSTFSTSAMFGFACLAIACWLFQRKEF